MVTDREVKPIQFEFERLYYLKRPNDFDSGDVFVYRVKKRSDVQVWIQQEVRGKPYGKVLCKIISTDRSQDRDREYVSIDIVNLLSSALVEDKIYFSRTETICGYSWGQIQRAQAGGQLSDRLSTDVPSKPSATEKDIVLLEEHGFTGLQSLQFFGVLDRLNNSGISA